MSLVRVLLPNGWEASLDEALAREQELTILDKPATNSRGCARPACLYTGTTPTPPPSEVDVDVWPGNGPPATPPPPGVDVGDLYVDLVSGDVYAYD